MSDVTQILQQLQDGGAGQHVAEKLLPLVYDELRRLAAQRMSAERPDHTLEATALVHEAYLRLVDAEKVPHWNSRGHFFGATAEAMRRILVENARNKGRAKRGGGGGGEWRRVELSAIEPQAAGLADDVIALHEALEKLEQIDARKAQLRLSSPGECLISTFDCFQRGGLPARSHQIPPETRDEPGSRALDFAALKQNTPVSILCPTEN